MEDSHSDNQNASQSPIDDLQNDSQIEDEQNWNVKYSNSVVYVSKSAITTFPVIRKSVTSKNTYDSHMYNKARSEDSESLWDCTASASSSSETIRSSKRYRLDKSRKNQKCYRNASTDTRGGRRTPSQGSYISRLSNVKSLISLIPVKCPYDVKERKKRKTKDVSLQINLPCLSKLKIIKSGSKESEPKKHLQVNADTQTSDLIVPAAPIIDDTKNLKTDKDTQTGPLRTTSLPTFKDTIDEGCLSNCKSIVEEQKPLPRKRSYDEALTKNYISEENILFTTSANSLPSVHLKTSPIKDKKKLFHSQTAVSSIPPIPLKSSSIGDRSCHSLACPEKRDSLYSLYSRSLNPDVNYVLVYSQQLDNMQTKEFQYYLSNLQRNGLQLNLVRGENFYSSLAFILLYLPKTTMLRDMEKRKMRTALPQQRQKSILNSGVPRFDYANSNATVGITPKGVTTAEKIFIIHQIVATSRYGSQTEEYGTNGLIKKGILKAAYPLHDGGLEPTEDLPNDRQILRAHWGSLSNILKAQPLELVNKYFGPEVTLYFAWMGYSITMLLPVAVLSLLAFLYVLITYRSFPEDNRIKEVCKHNDIFLCPYCSQSLDCCPAILMDSCYHSKLNYMFDNYVTTVFSNVMIVWAIIFIMYWYRHEKLLSIKWNLNYYTDLDNYLRSEFLRELKHRNIPAIYVEGQPYMPCLWRSATRFLSILLVLLMIVIQCCVVFIMGLIRVSLTYHLSGHHVYKYQNGDEKQKVYLHSRGSILSSIITSFMNSFLIIAFSKIYSIVTDYMTIKIESPRTQKEYINSYIIKLFILECFNNYGLAFYIAFIKGAFFTHPQDDKTWTSSHGINGDLCDPSGCTGDFSLYIGILLTVKITYSWIIGSIYTNSNNDSRKFYRTRASQWELDYDLQDVKWQKYLSQLYIESIINYGFAIFSAAAFTLAPLLVLMNHLTTTRINAISICKVLRRPVLRRVADLEIWDEIISLVTIFGIATSAFVMAFTNDVVPRTYRYYTMREGKDNYIQSTLSDIHLSNSKCNYDGWCYYKAYRDGSQQLTKTHYMLYSYKYMFVNAVVLSAIIFTLLLFLLTWRYVREKFYEDPTDDWNDDKL